MGFNQGFRYARQGLDGLLRAIAAHIRWNCDEGDSQKDRQAGTLQIVAFGDQGKQKQTAANDLADRREMVQQEMNVS